MFGERIEHYVESFAHFCPGGAIQRHGVPREVTIEFLVEGASLDSHSYLVLIGTENGEGSAGSLSPGNVLPR
jgi:hypothetical protein